MLKLTIPSEQDWDSEKEEFVYSDEIVLELEHSLVSLSKWEAFWEKPFMAPEEKTTEEALGYIEMMCLTPDVPPEVFQKLSTEHIAKVNEYINAKQSATWFTEPPGENKRVSRGPIITSELIYYWIFSAENIDVSVETWHLNRLFTLLKVFNEKNAQPKKVKKADAAAQRRMLNEQRKAKHNTSG